MSYHIDELLQATDINQSLAIAGGPEQDLKLLKCELSPIDVVM